MAIFDGIKNVIDTLTGEKERQRQADLAAAAAEKQRQERQEQGQRAAAEKEALQQKVVADKIQATKNRENEPGPALRLQKHLDIKPPEPEKPREQVAEQMTYQPAGLQRPPSIGGPGMSFVNPHLNLSLPPQHPPAPQQKPQIQEQENIRERAQRQVQEQRESQTHQQRQAERERQQRERQIERDDD